MVSERDSASSTQASGQLLGQRESSLEGGEGTLGYGNHLIDVDRMLRHSLNQPFGEQIGSLLMPRVLGQPNQLTGSLRVVAKAPSLRDVWNAKGGRPECGGELGVAGFTEFLVSCEGTADDAACGTDEVKE